jgi:hypothetical protein
MSRIVLENEPFVYVTSYVSSNQLFRIVCTKDNFSCENGLFLCQSRAELDLPWVFMRQANGNLVVRSTMVSAMKFLHMQTKVEEVIVSRQKPIQQYSIVVGNQCVVTIYEDSPANALRSTMFLMDLRYLEFAYATNRKNRRLHYIRPYIDIDLDLRYEQVLAEE